MRKRGRNVSIAYPGVLGVTTEKGQQDVKPNVLDAPTESYEIMMLRWQTGVFEVGAPAPTLTNVLEQTLSALAVTPSAFSTEAPAGTIIGAISGKTAGSTLSITPNDGRVSIDGSNNLIVGLTTASVGTFNVTIRETLADAANSPRDTSVAITVNAADYTPLAWDGVSNFSHGGGINVARLGFDYYYPWVSPTNAKALWTNWMTPTRWSSLLAAGVTVIRIPISPDKFLQTDGSQAALAPWLEVISHAVNDVLAHGIKALVDIHVGLGPDANPLYSDTALRAAYNAKSALWDKMKLVWVAIDRHLNPYQTNQVAFEPWNESEELSGAVYVPMIAELHSLMRAANGPRIKHLIGVPYYAASEGFKVANFTRNLFGQNVGIVTHAGYNPQVFSHQALDTGYLQYVRRLPFFPRESQRAAILASFNSLASGASQATKDAGVDALNDYVTNYQEKSRWNGTMNVPATDRHDFTWGNLDGSYLGEVIRPWMASNGVSFADLHLTEIGVKRDFDNRLGATTKDAGDLMALVYSYAVKARGSNGLIIWADDDQYWSPRQNTGGGTFTPTGALEPEIIDAAFNGTYPQPEPEAPVAASGLGLIFGTGDTGVFLDFTDLSYMFKETDASGTAVALTNNIARINDKSGKNNHAIQTTAASRPTVQKSGSDCWIQLDGTDVLSNTSMVMGLDNFHLSFVLEETVAGSQVGVFAVKAAGTPGSDISSTSGFAVHTGDSQPEGTNQQQVVAQSTNMQVQYSSTSALVQKALYELVRTGSTITLFRNGVQTQADSTFTFDALSGGGYYIGGRAYGGAISSAQRLNGKLHSGIFCIGRTLTNSERTQVTTWMNTNAGL